MRASVVLISLVVMGATLSCQPASPDLKIAMNEKGQIVFDRPGDGNWFNPSGNEPVCLTALRVYDEDHYLWQIVHPSCSDTPFPITFGTVPDGFREVGKAEKLLPGHRYGLWACGGFPFDSRQQFVVPATQKPQDIRADVGTAILQSPEDKEDQRRAEAIGNGQKVPVIEACSLAVVPGEYR